MDSYYFVGREGKSQNGHNSYLLLLFEHFSSTWPLKGQQHALKQI
jgi:hypothetical protein